jgi:Dehydrogenase E1 component
MLQRPSLLLTRALGARGYARKKKDDSSKLLKFDLEHEYKMHGLDESPSTTVEVTGDDLLQYYQDMYQIRRVETVADALYKSRLIRGFLHLYNGQEAICVGSEAAVCLYFHSKKEKKWEIFGKSKNRIETNFPLSLSLLFFLF